MQSQSVIWASPVSHLVKSQPDQPVLFLSPSTLQATAQAFQIRFPGLVTYAVKANPHPTVLDNLVAAGLTAFDVASPPEMQAVRAACPTAALHYNNPVRSEAEIAAGQAFDVTSWSVEGADELDKLRHIARNSEIAVRFKLPVPGAAYDFGEKFGATPEIAAGLLREVAARGHTPALTFHPGTQCEDARAWAIYIEEAARIADTAGVRIARLNVGGGFPADRGLAPVDLQEMFDTIGAASRRAFARNMPELVCEPGRAMVSDAFTLATRVKAVRSGGTVFLNDGIYGGLSDLRDTGLNLRVRFISADGTPRTGLPQARPVFGPTCDSLDRLPDGLALPDDLAEGDYVLFDGMGAYSLSLSTGFNGYGIHDIETVLRLSGH